MVGVKEARGTRDAALAHNHIVKGLFVAHDHGLGGAFFKRVGRLHALIQKGVRSPLQLAGVGAQVGGDQLVELLVGEVTLNADAAIGHKALVVVGRLCKELGAGDTLDLDLGFLLVFLLNGAAPKRQGAEG